MVGPAEATDSQQDLAYQLGRLLAQRGWTVVTGGLGGVMAAATRGANDAGGKTLAVLPGSDRSAATEEATVVLATGLGQMRNALLVGSADAVIAVGGSWGTLSEVALAKRSGKPVVCLGGWTILDADGTPVQLTTASTPEHAVNVLAQTHGQSGVSG